MGRQDRYDRVLPTLYYIAPQQVTFHSYRRICDTFEEVIQVNGIRKGTHNPEVPDA